MPSVSSLTRRPVVPSSRRPVEDLAAVCWRGLKKEGGASEPAPPFPLPHPFEGEVLVCSLTGNCDSMSQQQATNYNAQQGDQRLFLGRALGPDRGET